MQKGYSKKYTSCGVTSMGTHGIPNAFHEPRDDNDAGAAGKTTGFRNLTSADDETESY